MNNIWRRKNTFSLKLCYTWELVLWIFSIFCLVDILEDFHVVKKIQFNCCSFSVKWDVILKDTIFCWKRSGWILFGFLDYLSWTRTSTLRSMSLAPFWVEKRRYFLNSNKIIKKKKGTFNGYWMLLWI